MSSLERLGEAGWLPDVRSEESFYSSLYQACNQPKVIAALSETKHAARGAGLPKPAQTWQNPCQTRGYSRVTVKKRPVA